MKYKTFLILVMADNTEREVSVLEASLSKISAVASNIESIVTNMVRNFTTHIDWIFIVFS